MSKTQHIEVIVNAPDVKVLEKLMSKVIAEITVNRIDKLPEEIKVHVIDELIKKLEK